MEAASNWAIETTKNIDGVPPFLANGNAWFQNKKRWSMKRQFPETKEVFDSCLINAL
jgi:hypothetical protein